MKNDEPAIVYSVGQKLSAAIDKLAYGGDGVAHPSGFTVFVPRTVPGDEVEITLTDVRRRYATGQIEKLSTPSPQRIDPMCEYFSKCGGCHLQHISPTAVASFKRQFIVDALQRLGPGGEFDVRPIATASQPWNYRNRVTYRRSNNGAQGYISWEDDRVVDIKKCPIAHAQLNQLWTELRPRIADVPASLLPYVFLRRTTMGQTSAIFSVTSPMDEQLKQIISNIDVTSAFSTVVRSDSYSAFGKEIRNLYGPETMTEEIGGVRYHVRPDLFFQINSEMTERIVADVVQWAGKYEGQKVLDIYCGAGLFSLAIAHRNIPTLGIEVQYPSIQLAELSAKENHLEDHAQFRAGKADRIIHRLFAEDARFKTAVVDPPRKGLLPGIIETIPKLGIKRLLYVSCSPATFARDVKALAPLGYKLQWVQPYDMFPQTYHVELLGSFVLI